MNNHKVMDKRKREFELCKICRLNHNQGQRHKYFPRHKTSILTLLTRFQSKIGEVRESMKNPSIVKAQSTSVNKFWCIFCDSQVCEVGSSLACEKAINHLVSANHFKNLKHFVWKYGDGGLGLDNLRIVEADLIKWEKKCKSLKSEDAVSKRAQGHLNRMSIRYQLQETLKFEKLVWICMMMPSIGHLRHFLGQFHGIQIS